MRGCCRASLQLWEQPYPPDLTFFSNFFFQGICYSEWKLSVFQGSRLTGLYLQGAQWPLTSLIMTHTRTVGLPPVPTDYGFFEAHLSHFTVPPANSFNCTVSTIWGKNLPFRGILEPCFDLHLLYRQIRRSSNFFTVWPLISTYSLMSILGIFFKLIDNKQKLSICNSLTVLTFCWNRKCSRSNYLTDGSLWGWHFPSWLPQRAYHIFGQRGINLVSQ